MPNGSETKTWLLQELAAVEAQLLQVETAKTAYDASYNTAKTRLNLGKQELLNILENY